MWSMCNAAERPDAGTTSGQSGVGEIPQSVLKIIRYADFTASVV